MVLYKKLSLVFLLLFSFSIKNLKGQDLPILGMACSLEKDSLLYASGFRLIGPTVGSLISPSFTDEAFMENLKMIKRSNCTVFMCNVIFPKSLKIAGPEVDEEKVLDYLNKVFSRAQLAGIKNLILGSGGSRRLPEHYDQVQAKKDFAVLGNKMAAAAEKFGVRIIFENLNNSETNFITTLKEAAEVVRMVDHPNFRLNADIYHMMKENEPPQEIINAGDLIVYCEIAEKEKRTLPGVVKDDFTPYLKALKQINFTGPILIEGHSEDLKNDVPQAYKYLSEQLERAYR